MTPCSALHALFVSLRVIEAFEDPELRSRFEDIASEAERLASGTVPLAELPGAIVDLDRMIDDLDADLRARLRIKKTPAVEELHRALAAMRRIARLRLASKAALNPSIRAALDALQDPTLAADERQPIFDEAMGEPLLDATVGLTVALRELDMGFTFSELGASIERMLKGENEGDIGDIVSKSPLAFLMNAKFEEALGRFDGFLDRVDTPDGRAFVDRALNTLRAVYEVGAGPHRSLRGGDSGEGPAARRRSPARVLRTQHLHPAAVDVGTARRARW